MATNYWKCEDCKYLDHTDIFSDNDYCCPRCQSEDVFPERIYRCERCGIEGSQEEFFGYDCNYDDDPLELGYTAICPNQCNGPIVVQIR